MTVQVLHTSRSSRGDWRVVKNGRTVSYHRKKQRALSKARSVRRRGETLRVQKRDGTWAESSG